jgi:ATP diphosphatase
MDPVQQLLEIMARLRDPDGGCPWDLEQSFETLIPHTLEEAYEVAEAIEHGDPEDLRSELGDLLFQVVFYARLAEEAGWFDFREVAAAIGEKLVRRHPHVFGTASVTDTADQTRSWERHKETERKARDQHGALDGVGIALPALTRAAKLSKRAARVGFDWPNIAGVLDKVAEELDEVRAEIASSRDPGRLQEEVGDLLFSCVNLARHASLDPETALRTANHKFETRFRALESELQRRGRTAEQADQEELEAVWEAVKHST